MLGEDPRRGVTWVLAERPQGAEACVGQSPELVLLEGPAQLGQEVLQGDALGVGESHSGCRHLGGAYRAKTASNTVCAPLPPHDRPGESPHPHNRYGGEWTVQIPVHGQRKHKTRTTVDTARWPLREADAQSPSAPASQLKSGVLKMWLHTHVQNSMTHKSRDVEEPKYLRAMDGQA